MKGFIKGCPYSYPDFYGRAAAMAKTYCKHHPEADEETVFWAAQEAAQHYELSDKLRCYKFKNIVHLYIRHVLYKQKRKNKEDEILEAELKNAIIRDYQSGMTSGEIAERYGLNPKTTFNNITNWAKNGLLELRESTPKPEDKPKHSPHVKVPTEEFFADYNSGMTTAELAEKYGMTKGAVRNKINRAEAKKKEPAAAATVTSSEVSEKSENIDNDIISEIPAKVNSETQAEGPAEEVKEAALPVIDFIEFCTREVAVLGKRFKVLSCAAANETGVTEIRFKDENGFEYVLELRGIEEGT
ncbi:MAG: hypothetical protein ACI4J4_01870 [Ruminiclostridium sp.]